MIAFGKSVKFTCSQCGCDLTAAVEENARALLADKGLTWGDFKALCHNEYDWASVMGIRAIRWYLSNPDRIVASMFRGIGDALTPAAVPGAGAHGIVGAAGAAINGQ